LSCQIHDGHEPQHCCLQQEPHPLLLLLPQVLLLQLW
jgi:hypothetical protein